MKNILITRVPCFFKDRITKILSDDVLHILDVNLVKYGEKYSISFSGISYPLETIKTHNYDLAIDLEGRNFGVDGSVIVLKEHLEMILIIIEEMIKND